MVSITDIRCHKRHHLSSHLTICPDRTQPKQYGSEWVRNAAKWHHSLHNGLLVSLSPKMKWTSAWWLWMTTYEPRAYPTQISCVYGNVWAVHSEPRAYSPRISCVYGNVFGSTQWEGGKILCNDTMVSITDIRCHERHHLSNHLTICPDRTRPKQYGSEWVRNAAKRHHSLHNGLLVSLSPKMKWTSAWWLWMTTYESRAYPPRVSCVYGNVWAVHSEPRAYPPRISCVYGNVFGSTQWEGGKILCNDTMVSITDIRCHERHHLSNHLTICPDRTRPKQYGSEWVRNAAKRHHSLHNGLLVSLSPKMKWTSAWWLWMTTYEPRAYPPRVSCVYGNVWAVHSEPRAYPLRISCVYGKVWAVHSEPRAYPQQISHDGH